MALKIGALFAGYGGLDLAVESVIDAEVAWVSEVDAGPSRVLAHRYPDVPNHGDVTAVKWAPDCPTCGSGMGVYRPRGAESGPGAFYYCPHCDRKWDVSVRHDDPDAARIPEPVDVITGGSPCQDLSHAGKRAGMKDGTRSGLWAAMCEAVETIRPRLVVWENVRGALSAEATAGDVESCEFCVGDPGEPHLRALGRVLGDLAELGYDAAWAGLRAADVGAPHGRWRVFVLAWDACRAPDDLDADLAARMGGRPARLTDDPGILLPTPVVNDMGRAYTPDTWDEWTARLKASHGNGNGHGPSLSVEALRLLKTPTSQLAVNGGSQHPDKRRGGGHGPTLADEVEHLLPTPRATRGGSGTETMYGLGAERSDETRTQGVVTLPDGTARFGDYTPAVARWEVALGRPAPDPTEPTGKDGANRLSARFVEWMMGLPDGWVTDPAIWHGMTTSAARNAQLKALGNGVVPQQAAAAIRHLLAVRASVAGATTA